jgi:hypothetical protein
MFRPIGQSHYYMLAFRTDPDGPRGHEDDVHWLAGAGTPDAVKHELLSQAAYEAPKSVPRLVRRLRVSGRPTAIYRAPPYPRGGIFGGHMIATISVDTTLQLIGSVQRLRPQRCQHRARAVTARPGVERYATG